MNPAGAHGHTTRRDISLLLVILLLGAVLRALYLTEVVQAPDYHHPAVDAQTHDYWARGLAFGDWTPPDGQPDPHIPTTPFFRPPAYPFFLAALYAVSGGSSLLPRVVQMLFGLTSAVLLFLIGRRWFGRTTSLLAAAGMSLWWVLIYFEAELLAPALLLTTLLAAFWCFGNWLDHSRRRDLLLASALLGFACLCRPTIIAFVPFVVLWVLWVCRQSDPAHRRRSPWRSAALALLPAVLVVSLATLRNAVVAHELVLVSSNGGVNLYIGNNPQANGFAANELVGIGRFGTCFDYVHVLHALERRLQRPVSHSEASDWFASQALQWMRDNPGRTLTLLAKKACLLWGNAEVGNNKELALERRNSAVLRWLPGPFAVLAALAVLGAIVLFRLPPGTDRRLPVLLGLFVVVLILATVPFFAAARFRVPGLPVLFLFAGFAVQHVVDGVRRRRGARTVALLAAFAVLLAAHLALPWHATPDRAAWLFTRGAAWMADGQDEKAAAAFRSALEVEPRHHQAHHNLALLLARRGATEDAIRQWRQAIALRPDAAPVVAGLGAAFLVVGKADSALALLQRAVALEPDVAEFHANLSRALQAQGDAAQSLQHLYQAAQLDPAHRGYWTSLASMALQQGNLEWTLLGWKQAAQLRADPALDNNLAWVYATHPRDAVRNGSEALRLATEACRATQHQVRAYLDTLAAAQAEVGDFAAAVRTAQQSLSLAAAEHDPQLLQRLQQRLAQYRSGTPLRDASLP